MNRIVTIGAAVTPGVITDWVCIQAGPGGPIKRRGQRCYRDDLCYPNTFHTVDCPNPLPPDLGGDRPGSDNTPATGPKYGFILAGLLLGGLWMVFGGRKN